MKDPYMQCYLAGRHDAFEGEIDIEKLMTDSASTATGKAKLRDECLTVATKLINKEMDAKAKMQWIKDNLDEIREMGGDTEKAYRLYVQGRSDQLAHDLEVEVIGAMDDGVEDDDDEDEDEDSDSDDDEEDEEDA